MTDRPAFYLVWNPETATVRYRHTDIGSAKAEAQRLVRIHGGEFIVLKPIVCYKKTDIETIHFEDDDIPF